MIKVYDRGSSCARDYLSAFFSRALGLVLASRVDFNEIFLSAPKRSFITVFQMIFFTTLRIPEVGARVDGAKSATFSLDYILMLVRL